MRETKRQLKQGEEAWRDDDESENEHDDEYDDESDDESDDEHDDEFDDEYYDEQGYSDIIEDRLTSNIKSSLLKSAAICFGAAIFFVGIMLASGDGLVKSAQNTAPTLLLLCAPLIGLGMYFTYKYLSLSSRSYINDD